MVNYSKATALLFLCTVIGVSASTAEALALSATKGAPSTNIDHRTVAVILVNLNSCADCDWNIDKVRQELFTAPDSTKAFYQESSRGKLVLEGKDREDGDIYGPVAISMNQKRCHANLRMSKARAAAKQMGNDLTGYDQYIYIWRINGCYLGLAMYKGDTFYLSVDDEEIISSVAIHELGHNLGLLHSNVLQCFDDDGTLVAISDYCLINEYDDPYDPMGNSSILDDPHNHNWNKLRLGFLPWANTKVVEESGRYALLPSEPPFMYGTQALLVPRTKDKYGRVVDYYALDYRQPYGIFNDFPADDPAVNGVSARIVPNTDTPLGETCYFYIQGSMLVNAHPEQVDRYRHPTNAPIGPGERLVDPIAGLTISVISVSSQSASVEVDLPNAYEATKKRRTMRTPSTSYSFRSRPLWLAWKRAMPVSSDTYSHARRYPLDSGPVRLKQKCAAEGYEVPG